MGRHSLVREPATRRVALGATALAASATLTAGLAFGDGQAQASIPQVTSGLASIHDWSTATLDEVIAALGIESTSALGGVSLDPAGEIRDAIEALLNSTILTEGLTEQFLEWYDSRVGNSTTIAIGPGLAAGAALGGSNSTFALAVLGIAVATAGVHDLENYLPDFIYDLLEELNLADSVESLLPQDVILCFGGLAVANSSTAGSCANIAATVDLRYDKPDGRVELALTNPASLLTLLSDSSRLGQVVVDALTGNPIYLADDFLRLTLNGSGANLALTSDYGYTGPIQISWLGSSLVLFPGTFKAHGTNGPDYVNYLSLPTLTLGAPTSLQQIIPTFDVSSFNFFDLFTIPAFNTGNLISASPTSATVPVSALRSVQPELMSVSAGDSPTNDASTANTATSDAGDGGQTAGTPTSTIPAAAPAAGETTRATGSTDTDQTAPHQDTPAPAPVVTTPSGQADAGDQAGGATGDQGAANTAPITDDSSSSTPSSSPAVGSATTGGTGASTVSDQQQPAA
ncbi:hypothetical protein GOPIP_087_00370 [Gordonia polyisoprenivorans NBRC 16320 = JCM 10675]|uniref:Uncharacterized protein n=1 Tax=Gordonia polyisoprenivorans TaxID=84595 RepID=A0A846WGH6_9ACTN|nr:hypothetical protein [Gordonia polyisoprenivorans]OZC33711.1 hypothetical protein CJJ17_21095 [Gordonia polyisoprenivorans]GAB25647.1 hypothetical protein GOPIP_087_00370 [Gordonia polyisoprenivorans NBRC 16320 = JCM 10675]